VKSAGPFVRRSRRWPTLPRPLRRSTIGAVGLNDRVRDGNGCGPYALTASNFFRPIRIVFLRASARSNSEVLPDEPELNTGRISCEQVVRQRKMVDREPRILIDSCVLCVQLLLGVVKPHGRLGPLRLEEVALLPRAAYRRGGLPRPFRGGCPPGTIHLGACFPLRCIQRLSQPAIATRRCTWRCSRDTSGPSDSVLSY
jgi:hypothetical protein